jgi:hypothetical protein
MSLTPMMARMMRTLGITTELLARIPLVTKVMVMYETEREANGDVFGRKPLVVRNAESHSKSKKSHAISHAISHATGRKAACRST